MINSLHTLKTLTVLIAEDDEVMLNQNAQTLNIFFKTVLKAKNGLEAYIKYEEECPDLILADIKMPELDGLALAGKIRAHDYEIPIILLTAYSDQQTLLKAANLGIDGYLIKPLQLDDLIATCCKSVTRKKVQNINSIIYFTDNIIYNTVSKQLYKNGIEIDLGHKEQLLLNFFISADSKTLSKDEISTAIYPLEEVTDSALKNLISRLRQKLGIDAIINIKGAGWKLEIKS